MSLIAILEALVETGTTPEQMLAVARRHEAQKEAKAEERRAKDAERKRNVRRIPMESAGQTRTSAESAKASPHVGERAQVVVLTSSLRSEGTQEANASFVDTPSPTPTPATPEKPKTKPPKGERGTRLAPDWEPSADEFDLARSEGLTDEEINRAALEFRNYWCSRSRDATKLSWRLTWHNRVIEIGDRKRRNGTRLAASTGASGGRGRGATSFADIYAQRHGFTPDRVEVPD